MEEWDYQVLDGTKVSAEALPPLATEQQRQAHCRNRRRRWNWHWRWLRRSHHGNRDSKMNGVSASQLPHRSPWTMYAVGRYDENRLGMYTSSLFVQSTTITQATTTMNSSNINANNNSSNHDLVPPPEQQLQPRTLHIGIDLDGPVGTQVHAFTDGFIYAAGYNPALGDYGNVIVVQHDLGPPLIPAQSPKFSSTSPATTTTSRNRTVWALYGHLDQHCLKTVGQRIAKGQVLGRMGDVHENGGWFVPHVHFQLSMHPPLTHDMPGVVAMPDRHQALLQYPDPRYVLGPLY